MYSVPAVQFPVNTTVNRLTEKKNENKKSTSTKINWNFQFFTERNVTEMNMKSRKRND